MCWILLVCELYLTEAHQRECKNQIDIVPRTIFITYYFLLTVKGTNCKRDLLHCQSCIVPRKTSNKYCDVI